ncbi:actinin alpha 2 [Actinomortierella ambigua]|uniref:Actinin alpha 2 n=1 Tax=Actinomortierella ambigua TaxID=1343610 RepID=A0A9P6U8A0_9FUNG|nr:actinin alpha 2 [Actinomortierella ambigua]
MSWLLKSKRLQSAGNGPAGVGGSSHSGLNTGSAGGAGGGSYSHHLDVSGDDMMRQAMMTTNTTTTTTSAASYTDTQKRAFMRWVNVQLAKNPAVTPMVSIEKDLRDGKRLIYLLEIVSNEPLKPERGNMRIHQMANVAKALGFLEKKSDNWDRSIANEDIVDGNMKLTLGLIWNVIYRFHVQQIAAAIAEQDPALVEDLLMDGEGKKKAGSSSQVDAKQALLRWVRKQLEDYSDIVPAVQDFHRSWRTGVAFAALIHRHDPYAIPEFYTVIIPSPHETREDWHHTLNEAFRIAYEKMSVPRLLDSDDLADVETPDERSIMTYVAEYYTVMSKHQLEQDPEQAANLRALRLTAKNERLTLAGEDEEAARRRQLEEEERRKREEEEELERIRLRRMEIEGWSLRAAERAREEEEARKKRREEEEEKRLQRQLRREQREREAMALLQAKSPSRTPVSPGGVSSVISESEHDDDEFLATGNETADRTSSQQLRQLDPEELERRQKELDEKLAEYRQGIVELTEWVRSQIADFPTPPDTSSPLERGKDLDPLADALKELEEALALKEHVMSHLHDVREELLEFEDPDLTPEQVSDMDKKWWELETLWTELTDKIVDGKESCEEVKWIIDCSQEITRVNGEILKFETQLDAFAEKRSSETPYERAQNTVLEQQDVNLSSISFLLKTYVDFLTSLMDPKVHHHTAPEHLTALNNELTTVRLPHLNATIEKAQQNLANDRLFRSFLNSYVPSEAWIGESVEWLANVETPAFVSNDTWHGGDTAEDFVNRNKDLDDNLEFFRSETQELKNDLEEEQGDVQTFRTSGFAKLKDQAETINKAVEETHDVTAEETKTTVVEMMSTVEKNLEKVENLLPIEASHCRSSHRVLDYLFGAREVANDVETSYTTIQAWEMRQPDDAVEATVVAAEKKLHNLQDEFEQQQQTMSNSDGAEEEDGSKDVDDKPFIWVSVQIRHAGLVRVVKDLRVYFEQKRLIIEGDRQMKAFLERTVVCQATLRDLRAQVYDRVTMTGFAHEDHSKFDEFKALVARVKQSLDAHETSHYAQHQEMGASLKALVSTTPGSRQDPAIVQSKMEGVKTLFEDVRGFVSDRERDVRTVEDCQRAAAMLQTLHRDFLDLAGELKAQEEQPPSSREDKSLGEYAERSNELDTRLIDLEQELVHRYLSQDPSCTPLFKTIKSFQLAIKESQSRLRSGMEFKQQWNLTLDEFANRATTLEAILEETEQEIAKRGIAFLDGLADGDELWKRSEDILHETEDANKATTESLDDFKEMRMADFSTMYKSIRLTVEQSGGLDAMDPAAAEQFRLAEARRRKLKAQVKQIKDLVEKEAFQLEIIGQRLVWSQQVEESKTEIEELTQACQSILQKYSNLVSISDSSRDTSSLNAKAAQQLKEEAERLRSRAEAQKEARYDVALAIYSSLADLALVPTPGTDEDPSSTQQAVPLHLEVEQYEFKNRFVVLDQHLSHVINTAEHAGRLADFLRRYDFMDDGLRRMSSELQAEREAEHVTIKRLEAIRKEVKSLEEEGSTMVKSMPRPSDKVSETYAPMLQSCKSSLESIVHWRALASRGLDQKLDALFEAFMALLQYQDRLRSLQEELNAYEQWIGRSTLKVRSVHEQIRQMFSSWPDYALEQQKAAAHGDKPMVVFDVDESVVVDELDVLLADMEQEGKLVRAKKIEFQATKARVDGTLQQATIHSKDLQHGLEWQMKNIDTKFRDLETEIRSKFLQLQSLERRAGWEKEIEGARTWFKEFARRVLEFANDQARWKAENKEEDISDAASIRTYKTYRTHRTIHERDTARRYIDQLGMAIIGFEAEVELFESQARPKVDRAWNEFCAALALIGRDTPEEFYQRQENLGNDFEDLRAKIGYSAQVVTQRKTLEDMADRLEELEQLGEDLQNNTGMYKGHDNYVPKEKKSRKPKGLLSFADMVSRIRSLTHELEVDLGSLQYPSDDSSKESIAESAKANEAIREHAKACEERVRAIAKETERLVQLRTRQERQDCLRGQQDLLALKATHVDRAAGLLQWADETLETVQSQLQMAFDDSSTVDVKGDDDDDDEVKDDINNSKEDNNAAGVCSLSSSPSSRSPSMPLPIVTDADPTLDVSPSSYPMSASSTVMSLAINNNPLLTPLSTLMTHSALSDTQRAPIIQSLARLSRTRLESLASQGQKAHEEVMEMRDHKAAVHEEIERALMGFTASPEEAEDEIDDDEQQSEDFNINHTTTNEKTNTTTTTTTTTTLTSTTTEATETDKAFDQSRNGKQKEANCHQEDEMTKLSDTELVAQIERNKEQLRELDMTMACQLEAFDVKTTSLLDLLGNQMSVMAGALEERHRRDAELARRREEKRLRLEREREVQALEAMQMQLVDWSLNMTQELAQGWTKYSQELVQQQRGHESESERFQYVESLQGLLSWTKDEKERHATEHQKVLEAISLTFPSQEHEAERSQRTEQVQRAWSSLAVELERHESLMVQLLEWVALSGKVTRTEIDGIRVMEKRIEAMRWMHWELYRKEEDALDQLIGSIEVQLDQLDQEADAIETRQDRDGFDVLDPQSLLGFYRSLVLRRLADARVHIDTAKAQMAVIHETSKEIAAHAKFHADLVRIETTIGHQASLLKARRGALERLCCFSLNSDSMERAILEANEACSDAKYQLSVLHEVEFPALENTAMELGMSTDLHLEGVVSGAAHSISSDDDDNSHTGNVEDDEDNTALGSKSVQDAIQRIKESLQDLEVLVEHDCLETLMAAKFYAHAKATEDIRQWITACRDSLLQLQSATSLPSPRLEEDEGTKATKEGEKEVLRMSSMEEKLSQFGTTIQHYDQLSSEFLVLQASIPTDPLDDALPTDTAQQQHLQQQRQDKIHVKSMRHILQQTVQERAKRTREDWELLKEEFLAKALSFAHKGSDHDEEDDVVTGELTSVTGSSTSTSSTSTSNGGVESPRQRRQRVRKSSSSSIQVNKTAILARLGNEILDEIAKVSRQLQEMFDQQHHSDPSASPSPSSSSSPSRVLADPNVLLRTDENQVKVEQIEEHIHHTLQAKVDKFDSLVQAVGEQADQEDPSGELKRERMVGVTVQRSLVAESMHRLMESCQRQKDEVEEAFRVQQAMQILQDVQVKMDGLVDTFPMADKLMQPPEAESRMTSTTLLSGSSEPSTPKSRRARTTTTTTSSPSTPRASPSTAKQNRQRNTSAATGPTASLPTVASPSPTIVLQSLSPVDFEEWEQNYRSFSHDLHARIGDIDVQLDTVSIMADKLNDWRLDDKYGAMVEHWQQKVKRRALNKLDALAALLETKSQQGSLASSPPPLSSSTRKMVGPGSPSLSPQMRPRVRQTRASTSASRLSLALDHQGGSQPSSPVPTNNGKVVVGGRLRAGTAPSVGLPPDHVRKFTIVQPPGLSVLSPTFATEARRNKPIMSRKNDSCSSLSSVLSAPGYMTSTSASQLRSSTPTRASSSSRHLARSQHPRYDADPSNALDVEVAKVVNASGLGMRVRKLPVEGRISSMSTVTVDSVRSGGSYHGSDSSVHILGGPAPLPGNNNDEQDSSTLFSSPGGSGGLKTIRGQGQRSNAKALGFNAGSEDGRYVFGDIEPKTCYCRILRSRKVMVRVGGGWVDLAKFMEDHALLEQRRARAQAGGSATSSRNGSMVDLGQISSANVSTSSLLSSCNLHSGGNGDNQTRCSNSSDSDSSQHTPHHIAMAGSHESLTSGNRRPKEFVFHVRPGDDMQLQKIKLVKSAAGEAYVAI